MSDQGPSNAYAWLLASSVILLFICGLVGLFSALNQMPFWSDLPTMGGALWLLVGALAFAATARILTPR
ncbi:MAG: hypothetical protein MK101_08530 [Phycisphaerales bacterium]|nr:hypothetical protein [Phycisphaerales bacterium]